MRDGFFLFGFSRLMRDGLPLQRFHFEKRGVYLHASRGLVSVFFVYGFFVCGLVTPAQCGMVSFCLVSPASCGMVCLSKGFIPRNEAFTFTQVMVWSAFFLFMVFLFVVWFLPLYAGWFASPKSSLRGTRSLASLKVMA